MLKTVYIRKGLGWRNDASLGIRVLPVLRLLGGDSSRNESLRRWFSMTVVLGHIPQLHCLASAWRLSSTQAETVAPLTAPRGTRSS